jgi:hypothetical protein
MSVRSEWSRRSLEAPKLVLEIGGVDWVPGGGGEDEVVLVRPHVATREPLPLLVGKSPAQRFEDGGWRVEGSHRLRGVRIGEDDGSGRVPGGGTLDVDYLRVSRSHPVSSMT